MTSDLGSRRWSGVAAAYAASFATSCHGGVDGLLAPLGGLRGVRLLDVGTGTGAVAAEAARRGAHVTASDPDPAMVALAAERLAGPVLVGALPDLPHPDDAFDVVTAGFVVNQLGDPRAGVRGLARVARTVAVSIWPSAPRPSSRFLEQLVRRAGVTVPPGQRLPADLDFDRSVDGLADLLSGSGLAVLDSREVTFPWRVPATALWTGISGGVGVVGRTFLAQDGAGRAALRAAYDDLVGETAVDGHLDFTETAVVAVGRRTGGSGEPRR